MSKTVVFTPKAPAPIGPYNQAIKTGNLLFVSGQVAIDAQTGEMVTSTIKAETEQVLKNLFYVLSEAGTDFKHVVKTTIFLSSMDHFAAVNEVYGKYFEDGAPARETVAVAGLPKNANVEISCIATVD